MEGRADPRDPHTAPAPGPRLRAPPGTGPLRARDVCEALDRELLPKDIEGTHAKLKRLVKLDVLTEIDAGSFTRKQ
ncbi:hypothetical protein QIS99_25420 [Streptomyces sp. B-S-A8]|uniref:Dam-replacing protein HTH domain-containing protein n=1 Tax=Streptomyces solicavernae TaxID=3043614 RepID=A0ABT6RYI8_9ACTN|nr:hypothetical protein [Streptomyces sp. B-S-A8]MDI3389507.1 hypothetical protein [Streptomyces sp. B-S-A8]